MSSHRGKPTIRKFRYKAHRSQSGLLILSNTQKIQNMKDSHGENYDISARAF